MTVSLVTPPSFLPVAPLSCQRTWYHRATRAGTEVPPSALPVLHPFPRSSEAYRSSSSSLRISTRLWLCEPRPSEASTDLNEPQPFKPRPASPSTATATFLRPRHLLSLSLSCRLRFRPPLKPPLQLLSFSLSPPSMSLSLSLSLSLPLSLSLSLSLSLFSRSCQGLPRHLRALVRPCCTCHTRRGRARAGAGWWSRSRKQTESRSAGMRWMLCDG